MKRLIAALGVFALLASLLALVAVASPASAGAPNPNQEMEPLEVQIDSSTEVSAVRVVATATSPCPTGYEVVEKTFNTNSTGYLGGLWVCDYTVKAYDVDERCEVPAYNGDTYFAFYVEPTEDEDDWEPDPEEVRFSPDDDDDDCAGDNLEIDITKLAHIIIDQPAVNLIDWTFAIAPIDTGDFGPDFTPEGVGCIASPILVTQKGGEENSSSTDVPGSIWSDGKVYQCVYAVAELANADTEACTDISGDYFVTLFGEDAAPAECVAIVGGDWDEDVKRWLDFYNILTPIPLTVTKTFTGRDYYTTVDRGDFHIYTPGLCGLLPIDPFGGLLGNVGVYRTINASQAPQLVWVTPAILRAGIAGACTYRVQENNAPEGCTAVDPDGSDADGPYWDQTWEMGMTAMNFNIVNDCAPPPTPTPTASPTATPKNDSGYKKPSGGGSAAPKFTG